MNLHAKELHFPHPATYLWGTPLAPYLGYGAATSTHALLVRCPENLREEDGLQRQTGKRPPLIKRMLNGHVGALSLPGFSHCWA